MSEDDGASVLGYKHRPRIWYQDATNRPSIKDKANLDEGGVLDTLTPDGELEVYKSHLDRGAESEKPFEIIKQRLMDDSFHREVYTRSIDDMSTADATIEDVRDAEYTVELAQGQYGAAAHRQDTTGYEGLPEEIQDIFKGHEEGYAWGLL